MKFIFWFVHPLDSHRTCRCSGETWTTRWRRPTDRVPPTVHSSWTWWASTQQAARHVTSSCDTVSQSDMCSHWHSLSCVKQAAIGAFGTMWLVLWIFNFQRWWNWCIGLLSLLFIWMRNEGVWNGCDLGVWNWSANGNRLGAVAV